jgi:hypothetical protein
MVSSLASDIVVNIPNRKRINIKSAMKGEPALVKRRTPIEFSYGMDRHFIPVALRQHMADSKNFLMIAGSDDHL